MAEQTINVGGFFQYYVLPPVKQWSLLASRPAINRDLRDSDSNRYFQALSLNGTTGAVELNIDDASSGSDTANQDLSSTFETVGSIELRVRDLTPLLVSLAGADITEPYSFVPANSDAVIAFTNALSNNDNAESLTLIFRDFTPAAPSWADNTGDPISVEVGDPIADIVVPAASGMPASTYVAVGSLPPGVSFDPDTRTLSFIAADIETGSDTITIRATNSEGMADWTIAYDFILVDVRLVVAFTGTGYSASELAIVQPDPVRLAVDFTGSGYGFSELHIKPPAVRLSVAFAGTGYGESRLYIPGNSRLQVGFTGTGLGISRLDILQTVRLVAAFTGSGIAASRLGVGNAVRLLVVFAGDGNGTSRLSVVQPVPLSARYEESVRGLTGEAVRYALEITHPDLAVPLRIVQDSVEHVIDGNTYLPVAFRAVPPQVATGETPEVTIEVDNVGEEMMDLLSETQGAAGAMMRLLQVITAGAFSEIVWELPALAVGVTEVTAEVVNFTLVGRSGRRRPAIKMRHDTQVSPGLF